ncbi:MAG: hypothetical protein AB1540_15255 [Bdellovibrionota bacterium]
MIEAIVSKRMSFSAVPDQLFTEELSPWAFKVVAYVLGRPNGWKFHIGHITRTLGLSDKTWPRVRKELMKAGYFRQSKFRGEGGKFIWLNEFTDAPLFGGDSVPRPPENNEGGEDEATSSENQDGGGKTSIPPKRRHGERRDAERRDAGEGNLTKDVFSKGFNQINRSSSYGAIVENAEDERRLLLLLDVHSEEDFREAARRITTDGKRLYVSNLAVEMRRIRDEANVERENQRQAELEAAAKASAEKAKTQQEEVWARFESLPAHQQKELEERFLFENPACGLTRSSPRFRPSLVGFLQKTEFFNLLVA